MLIWWEILDKQRKPTGINEILPSRAFIIRHH